ncbi:hypothetical protein DXG01_015186 [Tephrocybe rancida]|nr:hypothetical protein DXG01_015186 [Tephrocybe rancida]
MFTTERLRLRAYKPADKDRILELYNDPRVAVYITHGFVVPVNADKIDYIMKMINDSVMFCIVEELETESFVGFSAFLPISENKNRNVTWGISISPDHWRKGYGEEIGRFMVAYAFRHLASHRVSLSVVDGNDRAIALYKRIGFVEEGRIRKLVWFDGGWRDLIHMGILDDEWAVLKQG